MVHAIKGALGQLGFSYLLLACMALFLNKMLEIAESGHPSLRQYRGKEPCFRGAQRVADETYLERPARLNPEQYGKTREIWHK